MTGWKYMKRVVLLAALLALVGSVFAPRSFALRIDGREVEDVYAYILEKLEEDARIQEEYRKQAERNPAFRGIRPYTYSSLSHLSIEDLLYGAMQGGLVGARKAGPNAARSVSTALSEANIHRIMELVPMLSKDFTTGGILLQRMVVAGKKDYLQEYLLKRTRPGYASDSLFALFWRDELKRNHASYINALDLICNDIYSTSEPLEYAMRFYRDTLEEDFLAAFLADAGIAALVSQGKTDLKPALALADEGLRAQMENPGVLDKGMRSLIPLRKALKMQLDPAMQREAAVVQTATELLAELDAAYPALASLEEQASATPPPIVPPMMEGEGEGASAPEAPAEEATPSGFPKIGIPTLKGF